MLVFHIDNYINTYWDYWLSTMSQTQGIVISVHECFFNSFSYFRIRPIHHCHPLSNLKMWENVCVLSWTQHRKQNTHNMHHNAFISSNIYIKVCYSSLFYLVLKMVLLLLQCIVEKEAKKEKKKKTVEKKFLFWKVYNWKQYIFCTHYTK